MHCLADLADQLNSLLPTCPSGQVCNEIHRLDAGNPCLQLKHLPAGDITIQEPCGNTLTAEQYVVDWTTGMILAPCTSVHNVIVSYTYNLAETYIRQAVNEVGLLIKQRNTIRTPVVACCGVVSLPCSTHRILSMVEVDCGADQCSHCGGCGCNRCRHTCQCKARNLFQMGECNLYMQGNTLILRPAPCKDAWLEICYEGGYPLDQNECFVGLTPELADLVLLKAQAIAYRNPRLLLSMAGITISSKSTTAATTPDGSTSTDEVTIVVKEKNCGKETTTTTKKGSAVSTSGSSSVSSVLAKLSSINWGTLATQAEAAYQQALRLRTESAFLPIRATGYRARFH